MKRIYIILILAFMAGASFAAQYCSTQITGTHGRHRAYITCEALADGNYHFRFVSADPMQSYNSGSNFYANVNGAGGYHMPAHFTVDGDTIDCIIASTTVPTFYVGDFFVMYADGEEWYKIPTDADFSLSCDGVEPQEPDTTGGADPVMPTITDGSCAGVSTAVDEYYTTANPDHAVASLPLGYKYTMESNSMGVDITVQFLDRLAGMAAPYLFRFDSLGILIGDPQPMAWEGATQTATYTWTGVGDGDELSFLVQVALAEGGILFIDRLTYEVGTSCESPEDPNVIASCTAQSTAVDSAYTAADDHAAQSSDLTNGYKWSCVSKVDKSVDISVKFLDSFVGLAAPQMFLFKMVDGEETLDGDPIDMNFAGTTASLTLKGQRPGKQLVFLVKIAYANHVLFTERIRYTVAAGCDGVVDPDLLPVDELSAQSALKVLIDGRIYIRYGERTFDVLGREIK